MCRENDQLSTLFHQRPLVIQNEEGAGEVVAGPSRPTYSHFQHLPFQQRPEMIALNTGMEPPAPLVSPQATIRLNKGLSDIPLP